MTSEETLKQMISEIETTLELVKKQNDEQSKDELELLKNRHETLISLLDQEERNMRAVSKLFSEVF